ncbi:MAG: SusD/RagB family nutrient-binding outer membrane lipoprotein [Capnocytophaga sp.]|nr:SusD/RagB family nutrient-binding outer membrane lipoprotein [Capnocytophaga sp.]
MKNKYILMGLLGALTLSSCSDFEEINIDPTAVGVEQVQVEYLINSSIIGAQQNPHVAERAFILYWKAAGRMDRINSLPAGVYNNDWTTDYYGALSGWLKNAYTAVKVSEEKIAAGKVLAHTNNLLQVARIWRVYLLSEATDNFGPMPVNGFQGENPNFNSVEEVYNFMLNELKDATSKIDESITGLSTSVKNHDPAYQYDFTKWKKYGNSMRMRLAMRLSEVAPTVAKAHFEEAVTSGYIAELTEDFEVQEKPGWDDLTGVMSREWNMQYLSPTLNNLYVGLGGVKSTAQLTGKANALANIKGADWLGVRYDDHIATKTNNPVAGYWFDGLPDAIDPRAYALFPIPGDLANSEYNYYPSSAKESVTTFERNLLPSTQSTDTIKVNGAYTWNAHSLGSWGDKGALNQVVGWPGMTPRLRNNLRNSTAKRLFFGAWESYFLIAEAAVRGWSVPMSAQDAYEKGIKMSFDYWGVSTHYADYIASEDYNRVGTSVKWTHTTEPTTATMRYKNGYTGVEATVSYTYPTNNLYKNGSVKNDALTKIITQKFIAQVPWLPLEGWSDHRRLGLPFFENPAIEKPLSGLPALTDATYMESRVAFFPQRLPYPASLQANVKEGYQQAVSHLGGDDSVLTPLWWAKKQ